MAESIKADISNAGTAIAVYDSVVALLSRLEKVEHKNKALKCLYD
jgi:hypothetical protein